MEKSTLARTLVAGGIAGLGLSLGGVALATADDGANDDAGPGRPGHGEVRFAHADDALAEELGVSEEALQDALEAIKGDLRDEARVAPPEDGERPQPPSEEELEERRAAFAEALAEELGIDVAKVEAALDAVREEHEAERRERIAQRLDEAVEAGDLTAADKASVLKAYDAGVLGGPGFGPGFGHPGGPGHGPGHGPGRGPRG